VECVKVVGAGGTTQFCALATGWLASQDVAELNITLQTVAPTATDTLFTPTGV
jgi:hypothetical protein